MISDEQLYPVIEFTLIPKLYKIWDAPHIQSVLIFPVSAASCRHPKSEIVLTYLTFLLFNRLHIKPSAFILLDNQHLLIKHLILLDRTSLILRIILACQLKEHLVAHSHPLLVVLLICFNDTC